MKKVVYLDVDGTLLNKQGKISDCNKEVILEIQQKGIGVVLATGRNFNDIQSIAKELNFANHLNYAICENGAYITKTDQFLPEFLNTFDGDEAYKLYEFLNHQQMELTISTYKKQGFAYTNAEKEAMEFKQNLLPKIKLAKIDASLDWQAITMVAFESPKEKVEFFENYFKTNFSKIEVIVSRSSHRIKPLFMISPKNISKASAINDLNELLKISPQNTYFFGDGINDVSAIKSFQNSFVPQSAPDYVKEVAHVNNIIGSANEDGVGIKLSELFLK